MPDQLLTDLASLAIDRGETDPDRRSPVTYLIFAIALGGAALLGYLFAYPYLEARIFKAEVALTEIALVSPAQAQVELTATGYVVPQKLSKLGAKVTGRVAEVMVRQGQKVKAGDPLIRLDELDSRAAIAASKARALSAEARVQTARANLAETEEQARRARTLAQKDVGPLATAVDLEARAQSLAATVKAAEAEARAAQAEVAALKTAHDQLTVAAPIEGTVLSKPPELGEIVGPASALGTVSLFELADLSRESLVVETDVPEARLHKVKIGGPCEIVLDAFPSRRLRGRTLEILPRVSRAKATVPIKVQFTDGVEGILPDMAARVNFLSKELDEKAMAEAPKLLVPASAVTERDGTKVVFVLERDSERLQRMPVLLGPPLGSGFELLKGPSAGTRVVRDPSPQITDGQRIKEKDRERSER